LSSHINDKLKKEHKFAARINDDKKETQKASGSQKSVVLPHLEVEYPLESADISNISQNSKNTDEKLVCQIYPLFEKDFFVRDFSLVIGDII